MLPACCHWPSHKPQPPNTYIGSEQCGLCHTDIYKEFYRNPHYKSIASGKEAPEKTGCERCHGPGGNHLAAGGGVATIRAFSHSNGAKISAGEEADRTVL
jgi:hypothetical protein